FFARRSLVYGSVYKFEGQVAVFDPTRGGPCYRCLFPVPPDPGSVPGCGEAGVLGALCGVIGSLQALEVIKLVTGIGEPLRGRLLTCEGLAQRFQTLALPRDPHCPLCGAAPTIRGLRAENYATACVATSSHSVDSADVPLELSVIEAKHLLDGSPRTALLVDAREPYETEICRVADAKLIPMQQIPERMPDLPRDQHLLVICHTGVRSLRVTEYLRAQGFAAVSNVAGGIDAWAVQIDPTLRRY